MKFKALISVFIFGMIAPAFSMIKTPRKFTSLKDLEVKENYHELQKNDKFYFEGDDKGNFQVTTVTPYEARTYDDLSSHAAIQYKLFERPRYYSRFFSFPLAKESGFASHKKERSQDISFKTSSSLTMEPTRSGFIVMGGALCAMIGGMAYMNGLFGRK